MANSAGQRVGFAETGQVDGDDIAFGREELHHRLPDDVASAEPVDEHERWALAGPHVVDAHAVIEASAGSRSAGGANPGFAKTIWRSRIRRSRKPPSENAR